MAEFELFVDLPAILKALPQEAGRGIAAGQRQALTEWQQSDKAPGLKARFTWAGSKDGGTSMRRRKYGSPTPLRVNNAKSGLPMPREAMPGAGNKFVSRTSHVAPNIDKPWFVQSSGTRDRILARKPKTRRSGGGISTKLAISGLGINFLDGANMHGVVSSNWVKIPVTYQMTVYKDSVNKGGAYKVTVTRGIGRWVHTYANRSYKQEFEDVSKDIIAITRRAQICIQDNLRNLTIDNRGRLRRHVRSSLQVYYDNEDVTGLVGTA